MTNESDSSIQDPSRTKARPRTNAGAIKGLFLGLLVAMIAVTVIGSMYYLSRGI